jgi:hypothetical protein
MYNGASGGNEVFFSGAPAAFTVNDIALPGVERIVVSFGASKVKFDTGNKWDAFVDGDLTLSYSSDNGNTWNPVTWTIASPPETGSTATWALASAEIPASGLSTISLKWDCTFSSQIRIDDIKVIGYGDAPSGDLRVSPMSLGFVAAGEAKTFTITSTSTWTATETVDWLSVSSDNGSGNGTVTVTAEANSGSARTAIVTVTSGTETKTVNLSQEGVSPAANAIYYEDMGKTEVSANTEIAAHTGWSKEGSGASGVTYEGNAQVRKSIPSLGYDGASGGNDVFFGTVISPLRHFVVKGIALSSENNIEVSFGASKVRNNGNANVYDPFADNDLTLSYSSDNGNAWNPVAWTMASPPETGSTATWGLAKAIIPTTGVTSLSLKWECSIPSFVRIDDIKVITSSATPDNYLTITPSAHTFTAAADTKEVTVASNTAWTVTPDAAATWCTVSPTSGSGSGTVTVTAAANTGSARAATITVTSGTETKTVNVTQEAPAAPETPQPTLSQDWESASTGTALPAGWISQAVGSATDKNFTVAQYSNNKYASVSSNGGTAEDYEIWLISPALDLDGANPKVVSFKTKGGYFVSASSLEVWLLDAKAAGTVTGAEKLNARIAQATDPQETGFSLWIPSGDIDLSGSGTKYIGFRYTGKGGSGNTASYQIDNFLFGANAPKELAVAPASLDFVAAGGAQSFTVISNTAWMVNSSETWCSVSPTGGNGTDAVTVTATANSGAARAATITISGTGVSDKTIEVTQVSSGALTLANISLVGLSAPTTLYVDGSDGSRVERVLAAGETISTLSYTNSSSSIWTGGWNNAGAAWLITSVTAAEDIYGTITVAFNAFGVNASPRNWLMQYSNDNTTWHDGATYEITSTSAPGNTIEKNFIIPEGNKVTTGGKLYIRLKPDPSTNVSVNNGTVGTSNVNSRLATSISVTKN